MLLRTTAFMLCASALWALMPQVARRDMALPSSGYGILLGSLGCGAVVGGIAATWRWRLESTEAMDVRPLELLPQPELEDEPDPLEGPVMVVAEYLVNVDTADEFVVSMRQLGRLRRRDGAMRWGLFRDP